MIAFTKPLMQGDDPETGMPVLGFEADGMFIHKPRLSSCGRFSVNPTEAYGISGAEADALVALNKVLDQATEDAINAGCLTLMNHLGVTDGGIAGVCFSGNSARAQVARPLARYLLTELRFAQD